MERIVVSNTHTTEHEKWTASRARKFICSGCGDRIVGVHYPGQSAIGRCSCGGTIRLQLPGEEVATDWSQYYS